jgi:hypothetical protein
MWIKQLIGVLTVVLFLASPVQLSRQAIDAGSAQPNAGMLARGPGDVIPS